MNAPTLNHRRRIRTYPGTAVACAVVSALVFLSPAFGAEPGSQTEGATTMSTGPGDSPGGDNGATDSVEISSAAPQPV